MNEYSTISVVCICIIRSGRPDTREGSVVWTTAHDHGSILVLLAIGIVVFGRLLDNH